MEKLYLGVAREIITPKVGARLQGYGPDVYSESVADDLTTTAFYFKQGDTQALMINATVCSIRTDLAQAILEKIEKEYHVPKENSMVCAIHTHSGPCTIGRGRGWGMIDQEYCDSIFVPQILSAVKKAMSDIQPVTMGVGFGDSLVGVNRRQLNDENNIKLGQSKWGCFNPQMTVLSFKNKQNEVVANIIHYGAHGTAAGKNHEITRDWSGVMVDAVERVSGGMTAFFNGADGDVGPRLSNGKTTGNLSYVYELGNVAAQDAIRIYKTIFDYHAVDLTATTATVKLPLAPKITREQAQEFYEEFKGSTQNIGALRKMTALEIIKAWDNGTPDLPYSIFAQTILRLGNLVLVGFPYEIFSQIAFRIDEAFQDTMILTVSHANGAEGYFVTQDAICHGGYEVNYFLYRNVQSNTHDADYHLITETVKNIKNISKE